jgi:hypothetical protein
MRLNYPVSRPVINNNLLVLPRMHAPSSHQTCNPLTITSLTKTSTWIPP